ncbi:ATP-binding protein [Pseudomonas massiliensis]|uniref:ATP-binding protein n=1 Tax=Pseudomonas massiliensis TaxID=522492 RepID=UPI00058BA0FB|nr:ATP-binding protein [Pseudomonas massiliensis]
MIRSLRFRLMLAGVLLAVLFMLGLLPALQGAFSLSLRDSVEERLATEVTRLISAARLEAGRLRMPEPIPVRDERLDVPDERLLGYIFDQRGRLAWSSQGAPAPSYGPRYDGQGSRFSRFAASDGQEYWAYDVEVRLLGGESAAFSFVAMQSVAPYQRTLDALRERLYLGFGAALVALLLLFWAGMTWSLRSLRRLSVELDEIEAGQRQGLSERHPSELLRLTRSLNRLLASEGEQRQRYRDSLGDLAHSLKTPLSVLQGIGEGLASGNPASEAGQQGAVLRAQVARMSQQIDYQLQRANVRNSGLVRRQVAVRPVLDNLASSLRKVYPDKPVQLHIALADPGLLPLEEGALLELLGNLLENAWRLCLGDVSVSLSVIGQRLELLLEDDGPGIPVAQRSRILERGERLDRQHPGQGIGLAVAHDIIRGYHGTLAIEDSPLGGARFRISFPRH